MSDIRETGSVVIAARDRNSYITIKSVLQSCFGSFLYADCLALAKQKIQTGNIDYLIINTPLADGMGTEEALEIQRLNSKVCILLIVKTEQYEQTAHRLRGSGIFLLTRPLKGQMLLEAALLMRAMKEKMDVFAEENRKLRRRNEEMGMITRAKCLLIEKKHMSESEAHHYLEKEAMNSGSSKKEIAQQVIRSLQEE